MQAFLPLNVPWLLPSRRSPDLGRNNARLVARAAGTESERHRCRKLFTRAAWIIGASNCNAPEILPSPPNILRWHKNSILTTASRESISSSTTAFRRAKRCRWTWPKPRSTNLANTIPGVQCWMSAGRSTSPAFALRTASSGYEMGSSARRWRCSRASASSSRIICRRIFGSPSSTVSTVCPTAR